MYKKLIAQSKCTCKYGYDASICTHTMHAYAYTYTKACRYAYIHTYIHTYIYICLYTCILYTQINSYINTYIHTYNNNYVHVGLCKQLSLRDWIYSHQIKVDNNKLKSFSDPEYEFVYIHKLKHSHA